MYSQEQFDQRGGCPRFDDREPRGRRYRLSEEVDDDMRRIRDEMFSPAKHIEEVEPESEGGTR